MDDFLFIENCSFFIVAWDQTDKFVKFYVTLNKVNSVPAENVKCTFTPKSVELKVSDLDGKDYALKINNLLYPINPETSTWKVKTGMYYLISHLV